VTDQRRLVRSDEWADVTGWVAVLGCDERVQVAGRSIDHAECHESRTAGEREACGLGSPNKRRAASRCRGVSLFTMLSGARRCRVRT
jgi:hypothetical protein